ncbi:MAG: hypothetical protein WBG30_06350 [Psychrilyobacter sp.]|uniref:hypothetical protein n=1 Tax=Psychrilyobacter sp. TaxID=2586924 RepID=UPI003C738CB1
MTKTKKIYLLAVLIILQKPIFAEKNNDTLKQSIPSKKEIEKNVLSEGLEGVKIKYKESIYLKNNKGYIYSSIDPFNVKPKLNIVTDKEILVEGDGKLNFYVYTNYSNYIDSYEILVYDGKDTALRTPIKVLKTKGISFAEPLEMDLRKELSSGDSLIYILKVYSSDQTFDQTKPKILKVGKKEELEKINDTSISYIPGGEIYGIDNLKKQNIAVNGVSVKIYGNDLPQEGKIFIEGKEIFKDARGKFVTEEMYSAGDHTIKVDITDEKGETYSENLILKVEDEYKFLTGLIDMNMGQNSVSGSKKLLSEDYHYNNDLFTDGRIALYYKKKTKDLNITAHLDTGDEKIEEVFKDIHKREYKNVFKNIDDEGIYDTYGDDSHVYSDIETQGKVYVKLQKNKSKAIWGNYNTNFTGGEFSRYNRSLYGAYGEYSSLGTTNHGESMYQLRGFMSEPNTMFTHNEFLGTGGSLYYLDKKDIVSGSPKVWVDIKDSKTNRKIDRITLNEGSDYEINEFLGRLILEKPLSQLASKSEDQIIKDTPSDGYNYYLNVDYEYHNNEDNFGELSYGLNQKSWLNDYIAVSGTYVNEKRDDVDYNMGGAEVLLRLNSNSYLRFEAAKSSGEQSLSNTSSTDGGLTFDEDTLINAANDTSGTAYAIEGMVNLKDIKDSFDIKDKVELWIRNKNKGFSKASEDSSEEYENYGLKGTKVLTNKVTAISSAEFYESKKKDDKKKSIEGMFALKNKISDKWSITAESKYEENEIKKPSKDDNVGKGILLGLRTDYEVNKYLSLNTSFQTDVIKSSNYKSNTLYSLGADFSLAKKLDLSMEGSTGDRGDFLNTKFNYSRTKDHDIYLGYLFSQKTTEKKDSIVFGEAFKFNDKSKFYHENQFVESNNGSGVTQVYGVDYKLTRQLSIGGSYENGNIKKSGNTTKRNSASLYSIFDGKDFYLRNKIEFRNDRGDSEKVDQWGLVNKLKYISNDELTYTGKLNYYNTNSNVKKKAQFYEMGIGFAYRPIYMDRLNVLSNLTYLYDLGTEMQSKKGGEVKAGVFALEGIYEFNQKLDVSMKYALRSEEQRVERSKGDFVKSTIDLIALKASYDIIYDLEGFMEYHILSDRESHNIEDGVIVGVYKDLNKNIKLGVGYNFTSYDDNLENLSYDSNGWFVNFVGKF